MLKLPALFGKERPFLPKVLFLLGFLLIIIFLFEAAYAVFVLKYVRFTGGQLKLGPLK